MSQKRVTKATRITSFVIMVASFAIAIISCPAYSADYSWQQPHSKVLPTGDLEWAPKEFEFIKGKSVRYIDYEKGKDSSDGNSKSSPWKHHPWDGNATGKAKQCSGIHTYVFKRGVVYYGKLFTKDRGRQSGEPGNPIRLTSDPIYRPRLEHSERRRFNHRCLFRKGCHARTDDP